MVLIRPDLEGVHLPKAEVEEDRLLDPLVDDPIPVDLLRNPHLTPVQAGDRPLHLFAGGLGVDLAGEGGTYGVLVGQWAPWVGLAAG